MWQVKREFGGFLLLGYDQSWNKTRRNSDELFKQADGRKLQHMDLRSEEC